MASELRVDTLKDASGNNSVGLSYVANGSAKAWVSFDGTAGTITKNTDSLNTTGLTDNGAGDYTQNWTNSFSSTNYVASGASSGDNAAYGWYLPNISSTPYQAGSTRCTHNRPGTGTADANIFSTAVHGDLA